MKADYIGVHATHCCILHGCKYGDKDCPVMLKTVDQEYPCEDCSDEGERWLPKNARFIPDARDRFDIGSVRDQAARIHKAYCDSGDLSIKAVIESLSEMRSTIDRLRVRTHQRVRGSSE